jgi:hypothetical protein
MWCLPEPFITQGRVVTMSPNARQVASGQVKPYVVGHHRSGVANDVLHGVSSVESSYLILSHRPAVLNMASAMVLSCRVVSPL